MNSVLSTLIKMQQIDDQIAKKNDLKELIPQELSDLRSDVDEANDALNAAQVKLDENSTTQKGKEGEIKANKATIDKYETQLLTIKSNKEYKALNSEIAHLKEKIGQIDEEIIVLMDNEASLKTEVKERLEQKKQADAALAAKESKLNERIAEVEAEIDSLKKDRNAISENLPKPIQKRYFLLLKNKDRKALVFMENEACGGCGFKIRPQLANEIRAMTKIHSCESCGRLITFKPDEE